MILYLKTSLFGWIGLTSYQVTLKGLVGFFLFYISILIHIFVSWVFRTRYKQCESKPNLYDLVKKDLLVLLNSCSSYCSVQMMNSLQLLLLLVQINLFQSRGHLTISQQQQRNSGRTIMINGHHLYTWYLLKYLLDKVIYFQITFKLTKIFSYFFA